MRALILVTAAVMLLFMAGIFVGGYYYGWPWVGVYNYEAVPYKTMWDWADLLIAPFVLAAGAFLIERSAKEQEEKKKESQEKAQQRLEDEREQAQKRLEEERWRETVLQNYLNEVAQLVAGNEIDSEQKQRQAQAILRAKTFVAIKQLDSSRNELLFSLLNDLLSSYSGAMWPIEEVDLSGLDFSNANLEGARLTPVNVVDTKFGGAQLRSSRLFGLLGGCDFSNANLEGAVLHECGLYKAKFAHAILRNADLSAIDADHTDFTCADLRGAKLSGTNLDKADFTSAIMPDGQDYATWAMQHAEAFYKTG